MGNQYSAPTNLTAGAYNTLLNTLQLAWTAAPSGITQFYPSTGTYTVDPSAAYVFVAALGGGGGGASGINNGTGGSAPGGNGGGAGGGYASAQIPIANLTGLSPITVTVGNGGTGGAFQSIAYLPGGTSVGNVGNAGQASSFGPVVTANGGAGGALTGAAAGGTASVSGSYGATNIYTETGGAGGQANTNTTDYQRNGGNSIFAGAGGGGGGSNAAAGSVVSSSLMQNGGNSTASTPSISGGLGSAGAGSGNINGGNQTAGNGGAGAPSTLTFSGGSGGGGGGAANTYSGLALTATGGQGGVGGGYGAGGGGGGSASAWGAGNFINGNLTITGAGGSGTPGGVYLSTQWNHVTPPYYLIYGNGSLIAVAPQGATSYSIIPVAGTTTYTVVASYDGVTPQSPSSNGAIFTPPVPQSAGFNGDTWGPNGGSATPVNAPVPVLVALSYTIVEANRITPQSQSQTTLASQMSDTVIPGTFPVASLP